jgi:hypothetical protein
VPEASGEVHDAISWKLAERIVSFQSIVQTARRSDYCRFKATIINSQCHSATAGLGWRLADEDGG